MLSGAIWVRVGFWVRVGCNSSVKSWVEWTSQWSPHYVSRRPGHYWSGSVAAACGLYSVGSQSFSQLSGADWCCHPRVVLCVILRFAYVSVKDVDQLRVIEIRRLCFLNLFKVRVSDLGTLIVENQVSCNSAFSLCLRWALGLSTVWAVFRLSYSS